MIKDEKFYKVIRNEGDSPVEEPMPILRADRCALNDRYMPQRLMPFDEIFFYFCHPTIFAYRYVPPGTKKDMCKYSASRRAALGGNLFGANLLLSEQILVMLPN